MHKSTIVFLGSNEPSPTVIRKLNLLHLFPQYDVHLVYAHRMQSLINMPLTTHLDDTHLHRIELYEPRKSIFHRLLFTLVFLFHFFRLLIKIKPHVIHAVNLDMLGLAVAIKLFYPHIRLVLDLTDTREISFHVMLVHFSRFLLRFTDLIFITSPRYASDFLFLIEKNLKNESIVFVPNAPLFKDFSGFKKKKNDMFTIGYFGAFRGHDAIENLVLAVKELREEGHQLSILFAGIGLEKPFVEKISQKYPFVTYYGPFDYAKDIKSLYQRVDIIYSIYMLDHNKKIHMSCRYSEAIVCGLPIIVQGGSYMAELVNKNQNGYIIEFGRWDELKKLLKKLITNKNDLEQKSRNCIPIRKENLFDTYQDIILQSYQHLLHS
jgi:glycosyltransferase involved in cell wall biosynthesis